MFSFSKLTASALALTLPLIAATACTEAPVPVENVSATEQQAESVNREQARGIAYERAGVTSDQVVHVDDFERDGDDGRDYWEIEFLADGFEHEVDVDARSGEILSYERDREDDDHQQNASPAPAPAPAEQLTGDEALGIALDHAGVERSQAHIDDLELDSDDGLLSWEVEFEAGGLEHEYDIDARSGQILDFEQDD